jgi:hypothetical protein
MKGLIFTLITTTLLTLPTHAGPDKTASKLMITPASLWDIGMLRLEIKIDRIKTLARGLKAFDDTHVQYNFDDDDIEVDLLSFQPHDLDTATSMCEAGLNTLQSNAGVDPDTGEVEQPATASRWSDLFYHYGYANADKFDFNNLDKKFKLKCQVALDPTDTQIGFTAYRASRDLLSSETTEIAW